MTTSGARADYFAHPAHPVRPATLMLLLGVSGAAALAHEVAWTRILSDVFGSTAGAVAVVLACFMAGMGAGGLWFGRRADRAASGLRLYGKLEIAGGVLASLVPLLVWLSGPVYGWIFRAAGPENLAVLTTARVVLSGLVLIPPSFVLGGTLPALIRCAARLKEETGWQMGRLYAANTAGAVVGCFATGYGLIPWLGVRGTVILAGASSVAIGIASLRLARREERSATAGEPTRDKFPHSSGWRRWAMPSLYGASGFAALGCEVLWTQALVFMLRSTVYAFTSMLTVYLLGLAAGGAAGARLARRTERPVAWFVVLEAGVAVSIAGGLWVFGAYASHWNAVDLALLSGWTASTTLHLAIAASVMFVPTFLLGMIFPIVGKYQAQIVPPGTAAGELLFANTVGGVLGSLAAGFVLLPLLGTGRALQALSCVSLLAAAAAMLGLMAAPAKLKLHVVAWTAAGCAILWTAFPGNALRDLFNAPMAHYDYKLIDAEEIPGGIVTLHRKDDAAHTRILSVSGITVAGTSPACRWTQILQGVIPTLVHRGPARICQVGLGSGETARVAVSALASGDARYTIVEISRGVERIARAHFHQINQGVLDDPRVRVVFADGRNFMRHATEETFDLILSESTWPFLTGSSALYTLDYFRDCRKRLAPGGLMSCWLPLDLPEEGLKIILATFTGAFPHATLWTTNQYAYKHALLLGSAEPIEIPLAELSARMREPWAARALRRIDVRSPAQLISFVMLDGNAMRAYAAGAPLHTNDRPVMEYRTALRAASSWQERFATNMEALFARATSPLPRVRFGGVARADRKGARRLLAEAGKRFRNRTAKVIARLRAQANATPHLTDARRASRRGDAESAIAAYRKTLEIDPDNDELRNEFAMLLIASGRIGEALGLERRSQPDRLRLPGDSDLPRVP